MKWTITWGERSWTEDDATGQHLALVVLTVGEDSWDALAPSSGPVRLMAWIAALVAVADGSDIADVYAEVAAAPYPQIVGALTFSEG